MELASIKKDFSPAEVFVMRDIAIAIKLETIDPLTITNLTNAAKIGINNPKFYKVMKYLQELKIVKQVGTFGTAKIITIDKRRLKDLIDEQILIEKDAKYFELYHTFIW